MRTDMLEQILLELNGATADIEASALVSNDGLMMASALPQGVEEHRVAAMASALVAVGHRATKELSRGSLQRVLMQGDRGCVIMSSSGPDAVLVVLAKPDARLGLIFLDVTRAAESLAKFV